MVLWLAHWTLQLRISGSRPSLGHHVVSLDCLDSLILKHCLSPPRCINEYQRQNAGVTLQWTGIQSRRKYKLLASRVPGRPEDGQLF